MRVVGAAAAAAVVVEGGLGLRHELVELGVRLVLAQGRREGVEQVG
jgi:hypothetical protein